MVRMISAAAAMTLAAGLATAGIDYSFEWVQVDNTVGNPSADPGANGAEWNSTNWVTYDLFFTLNDNVNGVNLGSAPGEEHLGLSFDTAVFNTTGPVASNFESSFQTFPGFATSLYDTYVTLGSNNPGGNAPGNLLGIALNGLVPQDGVLRGAWAHNPVEGGTAQDASEGIRLLRISFDGAALGRGGVGSGQMEIGVNSGVFTAFVPGIPTPGAAALLGLGGLTALRRRR